jgi:cellulose synthase/poly-beta-1,6-N-acetylglucosamine synthase-like glycosyltransferase
LTVSALGLVFVASGFIALIGINIFEIATGKRLRKPLPAPAIAEADLPHVLVQIPVFNEPEMVADALRSAAALDWPRDRLHIQLLDDSTDVTTAIAQAAVNKLRAQGFDVLHLCRADRTGYKAGALAAGMSHCDAPFVAVLDADFRPPVNWLRVIVPTLIGDPNAGFVQSRCEFSNYRTNWLTRVQGLMMDAHYTMEQSTRYRAGWLFQFNGTGGIWRREAIEAAGGWSSDSLCEDLDLTVRAQIAGWHGIFAMEPAIPGLVPEKVRHWQVQQKRWSNGFVQVTRKLMRQVWTTSNWSFGAKLSASFLILIQAFYPCAAVATGSLASCLLLQGGDPTDLLPLIEIILALIALVAVGMTLMPYIVLQRGSMLNYVKTLGLLTPLMIYVSLSNAPSILKTVFGHQDTWKRTPKRRVVPAAAPSDTFDGF